jgi:hypothetical protein
LKNLLRRIPHPSPALVIACVALAVALGGVGYAATVIPRNSVGPLQLKANSVNSSKVLNGSLLKADFRRGQIPAGPRGPAGAIGPTGPAGPAGAAGPAGPAGPTNTGVSLAVKTINSTDNTDTSSTSYVDLASSSAAIEVPSGNTATLVVTFSAESACYGSLNASCSVRINVDGNQMKPDAGNDFAFDSSDSASTSSAAEGHAMVRYANSIAAGNHTVSIQYRVSNASAHFRLDDWAVSVVAYKQ